MADDDELRRVFEQHTQTDVTLEYRRFRETMRSEDLGQFVEHLVREGLLPPEAAPHVVAELREGSRTEDATVVDGARRPGATSSSARSGTLPDPSNQIPAARPHATNLRLFDVLGRGGMGVVFRGEQVELGRQVAFKRLPDEPSETMRERFVREARITAQLDHPNIVPVHLLELAKDGSPIGYVMKLVEGKTLRTLLAETVEMHERGAPIDAEHALSRRLEYFLKICDAIAFAHDRGVLHRDLKPANFMIGTFGEVYVMDWGVARPIGEKNDERGDGAALRQDVDLTQAGDVVGSPSYMSPEQADARNDELDARSDQYALGLILFELVTLRRAVDGATIADVFVAAAAGEKAPFAHISSRERVPSELRAIVDKATAFAPADRYASVAALADDVRRFLRGEAIAARPDNAVAKLARLMSRHRRATLMATLGLLALSAITVTWSLYRKAEAELDARARGQEVTAAYQDVAKQAHRIDAELKDMERALEGLRVAAEWALTGPEPKPEAAPIYFDVDFADPAKRPADFSAATTYRWPVSVEHPVVGVAPGTDRAAITPSVRRLSPLRHHMRAMFLESGGVEPTSLGPAEQNERLRNRLGILDYAYVDLPSGVHFVYPGIASLPEGYDVRTAGFYNMSLNQRGRRWGRPYVDSTTDERGDDLVLPVTQGLWSPGGEFLGVAGVEITVTKLVERALALPGRRTLRTSLVDGDGNKVIDSSDANKRFEASGKDEYLVLEELDIPHVARAIREGRGGVFELRRGAADVMVAAVRLDVLGWYYVVEVDAKTLGKE